MLLFVIGCCKSVYDSTTVYLLSLQTYRALMASVHYLSYKNLPYCDLGLISQYFTVYVPKKTLGITNFDFLRKLIIQRVLLAWNTGCLPILFPGLASYPWGFGLGRVSRYRHIRRIVSILNFSSGILRDWFLNRVEYSTSLFRKV